MFTSSRKPYGGADPHAAGEIARPTLRPGAGDNAEAAAIRQAHRRADASIGPYTEGRHSMTVIRPPCLPPPGYAARLP